jgi:ribosomal protein L12E/L44/L45/RPP1/RPP2
MDVEMSSQMGDMNMAMKLSTSVKRTTADAATAKKPAKEEKKEEKKEGKDEKKEEKKEAGK